MTRDCGTCTMCCKILGIAALEKPGGQWCPHCQPGKGCGIYDTRPGECRTFLCDWLVEERLGPEWKPEKSKIMLVSRDDKLVAYVDPASPGAWRKSPYFETLNALMQRALPEGRLVYVSIADRYTILLPDRQQELGPLSPKDAVQLKTISTPMGMRYEVEIQRG